MSTISNHRQRKIMTPSNNFTRVKSGLSEIKNNLTSNHNMMSQRHKELQQQRKLLLMSKSALHQIQRDKSYINAKDIQFKDAYEKVQTIVAEMNISEGCERDEVSALDTSLSIFKIAIDHLTTYIKKCKEKHVEFKEDIEALQKHHSFVNSDSIKRLAKETEQRIVDIKIANETLSNRRIEAAKYKTKYQDLVEANCDKENRMKSIEVDVNILKDAIKSLEKMKEDHERNISIQNTKISRKTKENKETMYELEKAMEKMMGQSTHSVTPLFNFGLLLQKKKYYNDHVKRLSECISMSEEDCLVTLVNIDLEKERQMIPVSVYSEIDHNKQILLGDILNELQRTEEDYEQKVHDLNHENEILLKSYGDAENIARQLNQKQKSITNKIETFVAGMKEIDDTSSDKESHDFHTKIQLVNTYAMANEDARSLKSSLKGEILLPLVNMLFKLKEIYLDNNNHEKANIEREATIKKFQERYMNARQNNENVKNKYQWVLERKKEKDKVDEAKRIQTEKEELLRIQKEKEESTRIQREEERSRRVRKEKEEMMRIQREKEESERIQKDEEKVRLLMQQEKKRKKQREILLLNHEKERDFLKQQKTSLNHHDVHQVKIAGSPATKNYYDARRRKPRSRNRSRSKSRSHSRTKTRISREEGRSANNSNQIFIKPGPIEANGNHVRVINSSDVEMQVKPGPIVNNSHRISSSDRKKTSSTTSISIINRRKSKCVKHGDTKRKRRKFKSTKEVQLNLWDTPI